jgi:ParB family chromosome partitioning protein
MAVKKSGLGKGLDSLIPNKQGSAKTESQAAKEEKPVVVKTVVKQEEVKVKITEVEPNRDQPRKMFDEDALLELAESIKQFGVLQPLIVQKKDGYYEIIAGERRWRAAKIAGLKEVPVIIRDYTEQQIVEISLIENIQRENLNPIEEAVAFKRLLTEFNLKQDEVAERVSKSRTAVTNSIRLLKLDERVQQMLIDDMISSGHARALLGVEDKELQYKLAQQVFDEKLSVRDIERIMKNLNKEPKKENTEKTEQKNQFIYENLEEKMKSLLGTKVSINHKANNKGKIVIDYYSNEELERLMYLFQSIPVQE